MRGIKFRGKRTDNGEWVYGNLITPTFDNSDNIFGYYIHEINKTNYFTTRDNGLENFYEIQLFRIDPETVGQYTGLKDKNGIRIYECDIVKHGRELDYIDIVEYGNCCFYTSLSSDWLSDCENIEVIGNIYENQELLEDK